MSGTASDNVWIDEVMATDVLSYGGRKAPVAPNLRSREILAQKFERDRNFRKGRFLIYSFTVIPQVCAIEKE